MFKAIVYAAAVLSVLFCATMDFVRQRHLAEINDMIAVRRAELRKLAQIDAEVAAYQRDKESLQRRIDIINQLKQNQVGPAKAVAKLSSVHDPVDSAAVIDPTTLLINTPAGARRVE